MSFPKLIEVALPVLEVSAESVRDKSIRHGHISTLHLWWARRPLPVCRAVVFASLVPDPGATPPTNGPQPEPHETLGLNIFREAIQAVLGLQIYRPYQNLPRGCGIEPQEDTPRNRLLAFIGQFSPQYIENEAQGKDTPPKETLAAGSLVKWEARHNVDILRRARQLIWVAHNAPKYAQQHPEAQSAQAAEALLAEHNAAYQAILAAENTLYGLTDRHLGGTEAQQAEAALKHAIEAYQNKMPAVFDPFAGGGAIPLEAARLGCRAYGNDLNPVAHIIQQASLVLPQRWGKPLVMTQEAYRQQYGQKALKALPQDSHRSNRAGETLVRLPNRLAHDVEYYARRILAKAQEQLASYYPTSPTGHTPIAYYWARTATCANPSCRAQVPLLKQFYLSNTTRKKVYLNPIIQGNQIDFEIKSGTCPHTDGWNRRTVLHCPCCHNITNAKDVKAQFAHHQTSLRILAVIEEHSDGKGYRFPTEEECTIIDTLPIGIDRPSEELPQNDSQNLKIPFWGFKTFGDMFTSRQLLALNTLVAQAQALQQELPPQDPYNTAIHTLIAVWIDRIASVSNCFGRWDSSRENSQTPFAKQAIPMIFDFPEVFLFDDKSGSALNQLEWIVRYIETEGATPFAVELTHASSGDKEQFAPRFLQAVVTDPPYFDAIAYADLSDFFYVWFKRTLGNVYPANFATLQTPKSEECTALKHHHGGSAALAEQHFTHKLTEILQAIEHQTDGVVSIMFAHQNTKAWTTLVDAINNAQMNISGSWPIRTEMANRSLGLAGAVLASSVTVSARPVVRVGSASYQRVVQDITQAVGHAVGELYGLGFRGADLLTACFGRAVSVFGQYANVEKADGSDVTVQDLLTLARDTAWQHLVRHLPEADAYTRFYVAWLQLYGLAPADHDDTVQLARLGGEGIDIKALLDEHHILQALRPSKATKAAAPASMFDTEADLDAAAADEDDLDAETTSSSAAHKRGHSPQNQLATLAHRQKAQRHLGQQPDSPLIDRIHHALALLHDFKRDAATTDAFFAYLAQHAADTTSPFWRVLTALVELLPKDAKLPDYTLGTELLRRQEEFLRTLRQRQAERQADRQTLTGQEQELFN